MLPSLSAQSTNNNVVISPATANIVGTKTYDSTLGLGNGQIAVMGVTLNGVAEILGYVGTPTFNKANVADNSTNFISGITGLTDSSTAMASNYVLPNLTARTSNNTASITPVTSSIVVKGNSNTTVYDGNNQSLNGYTISGLVGADALNPTNLLGILAVGTNGINAGSYMNSISGANANYSNITFQPGALIIGAATAKISATKTYDATTGLTNSQITITGVNGESLNYSGTANANNANVSANGSNFVSAGITLSNGTTNSGSVSLASNYILPSMSMQSTNNNVVITPNTTAVVVVKGNNLATTYSGLAQSVAGYTVTGLVGNDAATPNTLSGFSASGATGINAGSCVNSVTGANGNYSNITVVNGKLDIGRANLTATGTRINDGTANFNDALLVVTGVNGETFTAAGMSTLANGGAVQTGQHLQALGTLTLAPVGVALMSNYNPLTIDQTSVSILVNNTPSNVPIRPVGPFNLPSNVVPMNHVIVPSGNSSAGSNSGQNSGGNSSGGGASSGGSANSNGGSGSGSGSGSGASGGENANSGSSDSQNSNGASSGSSTNFAASNKGERGSQGAIDNNGESSNSASNANSANNNANENAQSNAVIANCKSPTQSKKITIDASIMFEKGESTIRAKYFGALNKIASEASLKKYKEIVIIGHADSTGSDELNVSLSLRRAKAIQNYLLAHQVPNDMIKITGEGKANPIASNETDEGRAQNRRADIAKTPASKSDKSRNDDPPFFAVGCGGE